MKEKVLENIAASCGLTYVQEPQQAVYGVFSSFGLVVKYLQSEQQYILLVSAKPSSNDGVNAMLASLNQFSADRKKTINHASYLNMVVTISVKKTKNSFDALKEAIEASTYFCNQYGFVTACKYCGNQMNLGFFEISGNVDTMCTNCFNIRQAETSNKAITEANKRFNIPMGVFGAFLGALLGELIWILTYQMGFLMFITGAIVVFLSCFLLEKMGGKLTVGGLVTALVISFVMIFLAEYLALGISFFLEPSDIKYSLSDSFEAINSILFDDIDSFGYSLRSSIKEARANVASDLVYGFASYVVAAIGFVVQYFRNRKVQYKAVRLA